jgi:uncharacterized protein (DUF2062 family)
VSSNASSAIVADRGVSGRVAGWTRRNMPTRESLGQNRLLRPVAHRVLHPALWRFTRRSVPRGVAVGLIVGIFLMIPGLQIIGAALMAVPLRANVPVAAAMTFLSNPATTPVILGTSIVVGNRLGFHADLAAFTSLYHRGAGVSEWLAWLLSDAAPALIAGLFVISALLAVAGYFLTVVGWRQWIGRKWRKRGLVRSQAQQG